MCNDNAKEKLVMMVLSLWITLSVNCDIIVVFVLIFHIGVVRTTHGPLARYVKFRVAHAPGMPGTFSPPPRVSNPDMHHGTCVTHAPWCMLGSLTSGFLWSRWREKCSRHSRRMLSPQIYVSGKRHMKKWWWCRYVDAIISFFMHNVWVGWLSGFTSLINKSTV